VGAEPVPQAQGRNDEGVVSLHEIGESIDRLVTLELRPPASRGVVRKLYEAARGEYGEPIATLAARRLIANVRPGDVVVIATGGGIPDFLPYGETDGPLGGAALALAISAGLGAVPVFVTEAAHIENIAATCLAVGVGIRELMVAKRVPRTCAILPFPGDDTAEAVAREYMRDLKPSALVAVEKLGPNTSGVAHTSSGRPAAQDRARSEHMFDIAAQSGTLTIGILDNGNEIGGGTILEAVRQANRWGSVCQCPCQSGMASRVATDIVIPAGTSNWGAYGFQAAIAATLRRPELMHDEQAERRMLEACVRTGAVDGATGAHIPAVDGTSPDVQVAINRLLRAIVEHGIASREWSF
jgi:hypothetical protein